MMHDHQALKKYMLLYSKSRPYRSGVNGQRRNHFRQTRTSKRDIRAKVSARRGAVPAGNEVDRVWTAQICLRRSRLPDSIV